MKNLSKKSLLAMLIAFPSVAEQQQVAEILDTVDSEISRTNKKIEKLSHIRNGLLQNLFGDSQYDQVELDEIVDPARPICYGILMPGSHIAGGVPVIKVMNMKLGQVDTNNLLRTSPSIDFEYRRSRLMRGDVLLSIRGTVGRVAIVPEELDGANITQDTARITILGDYGKYIAYFLRSPNAQRFIAAETVGLAVKGINLRDVRRIRVPLPPLDVAVKVANALHASVDEIRKEEALAEKLRSVKIGLSSDLLTGRVRVPMEVGTQCHGLSGFRP